MLVFDPASLQDDQQTSLQTGFGCAPRNQTESTHRICKKSAGNGSCARPEGYDFRRSFFFCISCSGWWHSRLLFFFLYQQKQTKKNKIVVFSHFLARLRCFVRIFNKPSALMPISMAVPRVLVPVQNGRAVSVQTTSHGQKRRRDRHQKGEKMWLTEWWNSMKFFWSRKDVKKKVRELSWKTYGNLKSWPKLRMGEDNDEQIGADHFMLLHEKQRSFQKLCPWHGGISKIYIPDSPRGNICKSTLFKRKIFFSTS